MLCMRVSVCNVPITSTTHAVGPQAVKIKKGLIQVAE